MMLRREEDDFEGVRCRAFLDVEACDVVRSGAIERQGAQLEELGSLLVHQELFDAGKLPHCLRPVSRARSVSEHTVEPSRNSL